MRFFLLIVMISCSLLGFGQRKFSPRLIEFTYGGSNFDELNTISIEPDNSYLIGGQTFSTDGDVFSGNKEKGDAWVLKIGVSGNIEWEQTYGGTQSDEIKSIIPLSNTKKLLAGSTASDDGDVQSGNHGGSDFWIAEINQNGKLLWEKTIGGSGDDKLNASIISSSGHVILGGISSSKNGAIENGNVGAFDFYVVKLDKEKEIVWTKTFGGTNNDILTCISDLSKDGYLLGGYSNSDDINIRSEKYGKKDFWVVAIDPLGSIIWEKSYGGSEDDILTCISNDFNGGYLLGGYTYSNDGDIRSGNSGKCDYWLVNIDGLGNILWEKTYGGSDNDILNSMAVNNNGIIVLGGSTSSIDGNISSGGIGKTDCWIVKTNNQGRLLREETYGGTLNEKVNDIKMISTDFFLAGGLTESIDIDVNSGIHGNSDMWLFRNKAGMGGGIGTNTSKLDYYRNEITIHIDPANSILNIEFTNPPHPYEIKIYNVLGQCQIQKHSNSKYEHLDLGQFQKGIYIVHVISKNYNKSKKIFIR